jgi:hypothetical protein
MKFQAKIRHSDEESASRRRTLVESARRWRTLVAWLIQYWGTFERFPVQIQHIQVKDVCAFLWEKHEYWILFRMMHKIAYLNHHPLRNTPKKSWWIRVLRNLISTWCFYPRIHGKLWFEKSDEYLPDVSSCTWALKAAISLSLVL